MIRIDRRQLIATSAFGLGGLMLASGQVLEARAAARARRELSLLVERAPRTARRPAGGTTIGASLASAVTT